MNELDAALDPVDYVTGYIVYADTLLNNDNRDQYLIAAVSRADVRQHCIGMFLVHAGEHLIRLALKTGLMPYGEDGWPADGVLAGWRRN